MVQNHGQNRIFYYLLLALQQYMIHRKGIPILSECTHSLIHSSPKLIASSFEIRERWARPPSKSLKSREDKFLTKLGQHFRKSWFLVQLYKLFSKSRRLDGIKVRVFFRKKIEKRHLSHHDKNYCYFFKSNIPVINLIVGSRNMIKISKNTSLWKIR